MAEPYSEITLLECNRQNSIEVKSGRTDVDESIFTNDIGSVNLQPYDQLSVHSVYVSEVGAEGGAIEFKGVEERGSSGSYSVSHTLVTNTSKTTSNIEGYRMIDNSPTLTNFQLQDNVLNFANSYYLTTCGETAVPLPRNYATIITLNTSTTSCAFDNVENHPTPNGSFGDGTIGFQKERGIGAGSGVTPDNSSWIASTKSMGRFGTNWTIDNIYRSKEWNASFSDQSALGRNIFSNGSFVEARFEDRLNRQVTNDNAVYWYVPNGSLTSPVDYKHYTSDEIMINEFFDKYQLKTDNSKYTVFVRNKIFLDADSASELSNGAVYNNAPSSSSTYGQLGCLSLQPDEDDPGKFEPDIFGADRRYTTLTDDGRYPVVTRYYRYQDLQQISVPAGHNSTANIADTLTNQLNDVGEPKVIKSTLGTYDFCSDAVQTGYNTGNGGTENLEEFTPEKVMTRDISLTAENKTYKLFRGAVNYQHI